MTTTIHTGEATGLLAGSRPRTSASGLGRAGRWLLGSAVGLLGMGTVQGQALNYQTANAVNTAPPAAPTYADLGAAGTAITMAPNNDDGLSTAQNIGFTFRFNGTNFTQFVMSTNGLIRLGAVAPSAANLYFSGDQVTTGGPINSTDPADVNLVMPFNMDLLAGTAAGGADYRVSTTGTAPNQVCTIQWRNVQDKARTIPTHYTSFDFQLKLYETTNNIEFVYNAPTASTNASFKTAGVGLKGSGTATNQLLFANKASANPWSAAAFFNAVTSLNHRGTVPPDAGRTLRFVPDAANDGAVAALYTQGQLATFNPAHVVKASIQAAGTNATYTGTATLTVTRGATVLFTDSKPVTALASGSFTTVTFAPYDAATMANLGTNTVTVSLGADDNNTNNSKSLGQVLSDLTTTATVNYASLGTATGGSLSFGAAGSGNVGARFTTTTAVQVNSIQAYISNSTGSVAGVLYNAAGVELGRSAVLPLVPANAGTLITFTLTPAIVVAAGDFFAGVNLISGAALGSQAEVPTRGGIFYQISATAPILTDLGPSNLGRFNLGAVTVAAPACAPVSNVGATSITTTSASITFNAPGGATDYTVTYTPAGGSATTVAPNPTASGVPVTGLMPGTVYTVTVISDCGGGTTSTTATGTFTTLPTTDATVNAIYTLGRLPIPFGAPHVAKASVKNNGTSAAAIPVTLTVTGPSGFSFTDTQTSASTAAGANAIVTFLPYTPTVAGAYTVTVTTGLAGDQLAGNNTQTQAQDVNATTFGYAITGVATSGGLGFAAAASIGSFGSRFTLTATRQITAISVFVATSGTMTGELYSATGALLGSSAATAVTAGSVVTLPLTSPVTLAAGDFIAAARITNLARIALQTELPTRTGTFYQISGGTLTDLAASGFGRLYIEAVTATPPACGQVSGLTILNQTDNSVSIGFTPPVGSTVTNYTATLTTTAGGTVVSTQTVTASPVNFTGLTSGTNYTISIVTNCTSGGTSTATSGPFTVLTNLVVSTTTNVTGNYYNVTVTGTGVATVTPNTNLNVGGVLTLQPGSVYNTDRTTNTLGNGRLVAQPGSTISVNNNTGFDNSSAGDFQLVGGIDLGNDTNLIFNNTTTTSQSTGPNAPAIARSITVNSTGPTGISKILTLFNSTSVRQLVKLQSGDLDTDGQTLTLLSTRGVGTALIDNAGGIVKGSGTGVMQRAVDISTSENIGYHHYSAPVSNTTVDDLAVPGIFSPVLNPAFNTAVQAGTVRPFPTVQGYDERRLTPANGLSGTAASSPATDLSAFDKGFFSPSTGDVMPVGHGFTANVPNAAVVDFTVDLNTGSFNNGTVNIAGLTRGADAQSGWQFLGNPYPSPLDWSSVNPATQLTNMDAAMYVWHASSRYGGSYTSYLTNGVSNTGTGTQAVIDAGSGFFARVTTPNTSNGAVALTNANRVTTFAGQPAFGRSASTFPVLSLQVRGTGGTDAIAVYAEARATTGMDARYDATKMQNPTGLNLAALAGTTALSIDALPALTAASVVPLRLGAPAPGTYALTLTQVANLGANQVYLRDAVAGTTTRLTAGTPVSVTLSNVATATTRFSLVFRPSGVTATASSLTAGQVSLYPNPAHGSFSLLLPPVTGAKEVKATLLNALGQVVTTRTIALTAAGATSEFNTSALAQGVYMLRLQAGSETLTQRVVVE